MEYVFGPVPSRRLGRSLGVDLVPFKTCSYDCIYCQLGRTTRKSVRRREWASLDDVLEQLKDRLASKPDYITLSGSGEPTLYSRLGELVAGIRSLTDIPVAVLTNGSLLWQAEVRRQLMDAQLVIPSLDAGNADVFRAVNRPHESISFERLLEGLIDFRREYLGEYWLEVFILAGHTAMESEVNRIAQCVQRIRPARVQLNTATRPTAEDYAVMVDRARMLDIAARFSPTAEVIADYQGVHALHDFKVGRESVLEMIRRRPCSLTDIADGLSIHRNEAIKYIEELDANGMLAKRTADGKVYYTSRQATASR